MLNDLEALEVFASLCTTGSIQKTAQALGIDSPTASVNSQSWKRS